MNRILVIEDERRVADLVSRGLTEMGYDVSVAYSGEMGLRLVRSQEFDLAISDVILPGLNGFEVCKQLKETVPGLPVIMLTALGTTDDKLEGFDAGADDYMVKPFDMRELDARIKTVLKRASPERTAAPTELCYGDIRIDLSLKAAYRAGTELKLTPKEFNLLAYMVANPERVLSRTEIAEKVWNTTFDTGTNFIDVYINYLRKKVDRDFDRKLIVTRPGVGFILIDRNEDQE